MSTAAADAGAAPKKKGLPKKLMIMLLVAVLVIAAGGGAAVYFMKKKAAEAAAAEEADGGEHAAAKKHDDHKTPPTFVPLDAFTVNLADRDAERFAQVGVTLEVEDAHMAETLKTYMPAIRDSILMLLSHKSSAELMDRAGKEKLAHDIGVQSARAMGYDIVEDDEADAAPAHKDKAADADEEEDPKPKKKKKKKPAGDVNPIKHVLFSNFIIQ